ncbi:MAG: NUDIX hydrolase [Egibacteraceae bacterium]
MSQTVRAAGAVLWRCGDDGLELAVIHRPKYDDWSLPKGKLDPGETEVEAAVREVQEETGYTGELGGDLGEVSYVHERRGEARDKRVRYWSMRAGEGRFVPGDEVDLLEWLAPEDALDKLSYDRDRDVAQRFLAQLGTP